MRICRYASHSEALRDILRGVDARQRLGGGGKANSFCVAALSYVYDHETRGLGQRLTQSQHSHHDLQVATLHVHLEHDACLEVSVLRGPVKAVRALPTIPSANAACATANSIWCQPTVRAAVIRTAAAHANTSTSTPRPGLLGGVLVPVLQICKLNAQAVGPVC